VLALGSSLLFRRAVGALLFRRRRPVSHAKRVVIVGLDGLDPGVATRMMDRGELPTLAALARTRHFPAEHDVSADLARGVGVFATG